MLITASISGPNGGDAADGPQREQREAGVDLQQLETEAREYPGADHVRDHDGDNGRGAEFAVRRAGHPVN